MRLLTIATETNDVTDGVSNTKTFYGSEKLMNFSYIQACYGCEKKQQQRNYHIKNVLYFYGMRINSEKYLYEKKSKVKRFRIKKTRIQTSAPKSDKC